MFFISWFEMNWEVVFRALAWGREYTYSYL